MKRKIVLLLTGCLLAINLVACSGNTNEIIVKNKNIETLNEEITLKEIEKIIITDETEYTNEQLTFIRDFNDLIDFFNGTIETFNISPLAEDTDKVMELKELVSKIKSIMLLSENPKTLTPKNIEDYNCFIGNTSSYLSDLLQTLMQIPSYDSVTQDNIANTNTDDGYSNNNPDFMTVTDVESEEFSQNSPLQQFEICVGEINNSKYDNVEKFELADRITTLYNETTDKETKEKMDNIVKQQLFKNGQLIEFFPEFNDNEELALFAMENGAYLIQLSDRLQHDKEFIIKALDKHTNGVLGSIDKEILTDREFCLHMFKKGYLEIYNRLIDEVSYSNDEKAKELIKDKEIITEIYKSMEVMEFDDMKELNEYIANPQLLADRLFGLFGEDFKTKRLEYAAEFNAKK